tara:strand:- start:193 stop:396 length:204 start_codon:yes stop_codon:yes gene_type:complete
MKLLYVLLAAQMIYPVTACENSEFNPDGDSFFYEECLHMNRGKFTEELNAKCTKYAEEKLKEEIISR